MATSSTLVEPPPALRVGFPVRGGIVETVGVDGWSGRNRVAAAFYDGPGWTRFQKVERFFLWTQGGQRRARRPILRRLPDVASARVLEVGVGDGENLRFLPPAWEVHGVDVARTRLAACLARFPTTAGRLAWAEAEDLPYRDAAFDACYTVGGFNYFRDHAAAVREMRRVTRPGGIVVAADEAPWLHRCGIGHLLGVPKLDAAWLRALGLDRDFAAMVLDTKVDLDAIFPPELGWTRTSIWRGLGYCAFLRC